MSTPTITRAAELLDESAADLRDCHTLSGDWGDEHEAREVHDEMLAVAADLRAMIAAAPRPPASVSQWPTWQPIETAPKDGTALLLWEEASIHPFVGWWAMGGWKVSHEHVDAEGGWDGAVVVDRLIMPITHWMPLPPAPGEAAQPADVARLVEALDWIDDFIARCNGDDRGACEAVNRVRAALAAKGDDHA